MDADDGAFRPGTGLGGQWSEGCDRTGGQRRLLSISIRTIGRSKTGFLRERLLAMLSSFFGILAAVLATSRAVRGVIAYIVARRTNEIGIRMALGASPRQILAMVVGEAGSLLIVGVMIGTVLAVAAGKSAATLLYGLKPYDPLTLVLAAAGLGAVAIAARACCRRGEAAKLRNRWWRCETSEGCE